MMRRKDLYRIVVGNLIRLKFRAILTILGVVIGTATIVVMVSLGLGMQKSATSSLEREFGGATLLQVVPKGSTAFGDVESDPQSPSDKPSEAKVKLDDEVVTELKAIEAAAAVMPQIEVGESHVEYGKHSSSGSLVGVEPYQMKEFGLKVSKGRELTSGKKVVLGAKVFENLTSSVGSRSSSSLDLIGKKVSLKVIGEANLEEADAAMSSSAGRTKTVRATVTGVLEEKGAEYDMSVYTSLKRARHLQQQLGINSKKRKQYQKVLIKVSSLPKIDSVEKKIKKMGLSTFSLKDILRGIKTFFAIVQIFLGGIGTVALVVASLGIANTMTMAIYERTREIGIMKAVGASNQNIMRLFLAEAGVIGLLGGVLGVVSGYLGVQLINLGIKYYLVGQNVSGGGIDFSLYTPLWLVGVGIVFATVVGLVSGVFPAFRAAHLNPLGALRHE